MPCCRLINGLRFDGLLILYLLTTYCVSKLDALGQKTGLPHQEACSAVEFRPV